MTDSNQEEIILVGWKSIAQACGNLSIKTIRLWAKDYGMPIKKINNKPLITKHKLEMWVNKLPKP